MYQAKVSCNTTNTQKYILKLYKNISCEDSACLVVTNGIFLPSHLSWKGFGGRGVLPGVATGAGVGPQTGLLMHSTLTTLKKQRLVGYTCLKIKHFTLFLTGVLGQGGAGQGGTGSKGHKS